MAGPTSTTKPARQTGEARPSHPERKSPAIVQEEVEAHPPLQEAAATLPGQRWATPLPRLVVRGWLWLLYSLGTIHVEREK